MTAVNHPKNKERIKKIIDTDSDLSNKKGADGKLRNFLVGHPPGDNRNAQVKPYGFISNNSRFEERKQKGSNYGEQKGSHDNIARYDIFVYQQGNNSSDAEAKTDLLHAKVINALEKNANLKDPIANNDPICEHFELIRTERLNEQIGKNIDGFRITIELTIVTV